MPTLNLTSEDRDYFTRAAQTAREWHDRVVRPTETQDTEREIAENTGGEVRPSRRPRTYGELYGMPIQEAAEALRGFGQSMNRATTQFYPWLADAYEQARSRPMAYDHHQIDDWLNITLPRSISRSPVRFIEHETTFNVRRNHGPDAIIRYSDGAEIAAQGMDINRVGVFIGGPNNGRVFGHDDRNEFQRGGRPDWRVIMREPLDYSSIRTWRDAEMDIRQPTYNEVRYAICRYELPPAFNLGDYFLVLRAEQ